MASSWQGAPANWSNKNEVEYFDPETLDSLSRVMMRAVAEEDSYFNITSGGRTKQDQIDLFEENYYYTGRTYKKLPGDRWYGDTVWARRDDSVAVASPNLYGTGTGANHTRGIAADIVPAAIQGYMQREGHRSGWSWAEGKRNGEPWHFVHDPDKDQYRHEGFLDHGAVQKVVGARVDNKIGPATAAKIREWQAEHGLTADGKVGANTKAAMGLTDGTPAAPAGGASAPNPVSKATAEPGWMPGVDRSQTFSGNPHKATVSKLVLHTTEGSSWPGYGGGGSAPHFTVKPGPPSAETIRQHIPTTEASKALVNRSGGVETNNAGAVQVEYIGSCDKDYASKHSLFFTEDAEDDDLASLAAVVAWVCAAHDIPLTAGAGLSWPTTNAAYASAPQRLSGTEWDAYTGILGHTHVPENDHWDPGNFPVGLLLELAGGAIVLTPTSPIPAGDLADQFPHGKKALMAMAAAPDFPLLRTPGNLCYYGSPDGPIESVSGKSPNSLNPGEIFGSGDDSGAHGLKTWQAKMGIEADGRYGNGTEAKAKALQKRAGLIVDGKIGPSTFVAPWLLWPES